MSIAEQKSQAYRDLKARLARGYTIPAFQVPMFMKPIGLRMLVTDEDAVKFLMERDGLSIAKARKKWVALKRQREEAQANRVVASQGLCDTTMTERFDQVCTCDTYAGNKGPCNTFEAGDNGRCAYCDHGHQCHETVVVRA